MDSIDSRIQSIIKQLWSLREEIGLFRDYEPDVEYQQQQVEYAVMDLEKILRG